jgi:hypothetical protein
VCTGRRWRGLRRRTTFRRSSLGAWPENGLFVAVGAYGAILTSPGRVSWTAQTSPTIAWLFSLTYGNGLFVAVGVYGTILTSP